MPQQQLDLFKLAACGPAGLCAGPASVMRREAGHASISRILLEHLPYDLLGYGLALYLVASIHWAEYAALGQAGDESPGVDCDFHPGRHRHGADAAVLADKVDDAPATVALLDVCECECRHLRSPEAAAEEDG